jgi:hypothetical protein
MNKATRILRCETIKTKIRNMPHKYKNILPIIDGILCYERYFHSPYKTKILWVTKEPNYHADPQKTRKPVGGFDNTENGCQEDDNWNSQMGKRMKILTYCILKGISGKNNIKAVCHDFSKENKELYSAITNTAWINVKKTPGGSTSSMREIRQAYKENKDILLEQIDTFIPNIVLFGNVIQYFEQDAPLKGLEKHGRHPFFWYSTDERIYINLYHPGFRENKPISTINYITEVLNIIISWKKNVI